MCQTPFDALRQRYVTLWQQVPPLMVAFRLKLTPIDVAALPDPATPPASPTLTRRAFHVLPKLRSLAPWVYACPACPACPTCPARWPQARRAGRPPQPPKRGVPWPRTLTRAVVNRIDARLDRGVEALSWC
jgi:hypothetical protein